MRTVRVNGTAIHILPVVKGLVSEAEAVSKAFEEVGPDAVAISISKEELSALRIGEDDEKYEMSDLEVVYAAHLETFGEVELPPPCYVRSMEVCETKKVPLIPLDMNNAAYTEAYCSNVRTLDMFRESFFARRAIRKQYDLSSPQSFAIDWDGKVNRAKGFRELERARERHMASILGNMGRKYHNILAVIECERAEGVERALVAGSAPLDADLSSAESHVS